MKTRFPDRVFVANQCVALDTKGIHIGINSSNFNFMFFTVCFRNTVHRKVTWLPVSSFHALVESSKNGDEAKDIFDQEFSQFHHACTVYSNGYHYTFSC